MKASPGRSTSFQQARTPNLPKCHLFGFGEVSGTKVEPAPQHSTNINQMTNWDHPTNQAPRSIESQHLMPDAQLLAEFEVVCNVVWTYLHMICDQRLQSAHAYIYLQVYVWVYVYSIPILIPYSYNYIDMACTHALLPFTLFSYVYYVDARVILV